MCVVVSPSVMSNSETSWTAAYQVPPSIELYICNFKGLEIETLIRKGL